MCVYVIKGQKRPGKFLRKFSVVLSDSGTISQSVMEMTSIECVPLKNTQPDYDSALISMQM